MGLVHASPSVPPAEVWGSSGARVCLLSVLECMLSVAHTSVNCAADTPASVGVGPRTADFLKVVERLGKSFSLLKVSPIKCSCLRPLQREDISLISFLIIEG